MRRKYKLETGSCTNKAKAVKIIFNYNKSVEVANTCFDRQELEADPEDNNYRELIEDLDSVGVQVYDMEKIQLPKTIITHEQPCYT